MEIINLAELLERIGERSLQEQAAAIRFGLAWRCATPEMRTIADLGARMGAALRHEYDFFFDAHGRQVGYVCTAPAVGYRCDPAYAAPMQALRAAQGAIDAAALPVGPVSWPPRELHGKYVPPRTLAMRQADFASIVPAVACLRLAYRCRAYDTAPAAALSAKLYDQLSTRQIKLFRSATGRIQGFLSWAWLAPQTIENIAAQALHFTDYAEWREGAVLALCDCVYERDIAATLRKEILEGLHPEQDRMAIYCLPDVTTVARLLSFDRTAAPAAFDQWLNARGIHV